MNVFTRHIFCLSAAALLFACIVQPVPVFAASAATTAQTVVSTNVTADSMVYDSAAQKVTFSGKVKVTHPDFILVSDRLVLYLSDAKSDKNANSNAGAVNRIIAESKVRINLPEGRIATCNKATYTVSSETLLMEGSPELREGNNKIRGDKMIFYLRENRNEVQGRVEVDFVADDLKSQGGAMFPGAAGN
ncbi:organic solvent tolerance protein OstA [Desulfovibrio sp. OttesenSCG-928-F07]|nr:organic solvent tolerance protein OstA [Desulfovibrio sp. OttesenSCG-928-F07]